MRAQCFLPPSPFIAVVVVTIISMSGGDFTSSGILHAAAQQQQQCPNPPDETTNTTIVSPALINAIVAAHNAYRRNVSNPKAAAMPMLQWDAAIAANAQAYIDTCPGMVHSNVATRTNVAGYARLGENMAGGPLLSQNGFVYSIGLWGNERSDFTFVPTCSTPTLVCGTCSAVPPNSCGHYTQVVWNTTLKVGCGYKQCSGTWYYICQYGPAGNIGGYAPYLGVAPGSPGACDPGGATTSTAPAGSTTAPASGGVSTTTTASAGPPASTTTPGTTSSSGGANSNVPTSSSNPTGMQSTTAGGSNPMATTTTVAAGPNPSTTPMAPPPPPPPPATTLNTTGGGAAEEGMPQSTKIAIGAAVLAVGALVLIGAVIFVCRRLSEKKLSSASMNAPIERESSPHATPLMQTEDDMAEMGLRPAARSTGNSDPKALL